MHCNHDILGSEETNKRTVLLVCSYHHAGFCAKTGNMAGSCLQQPAEQKTGYVTTKKVLPRVPAVPYTAFLQWLRSGNPDLPWTSKAWISQWIDRPNIFINDSNSKLRRMPIECIDIKYIVSTHIYITFSWSCVFFWGDYHGEICHCQSH